MRTRSILTGLFACMLICPWSALAEKPAYPKPTPPKDASSYGKHIQRSMTLMSASTPKKRSTVRILHYGQSIVGQRWSTFVDADLRRRFPNTEFVSKNLAIGGFSSQLLVRTMHYDVLPFYPDLIVFHVYGSHVDYEKIIKEMRTRTTAEIIIQTDHANKWPEPRAKGVWQQKTWDAKMNRWFLPQFAAKYRCALQPQRWEWEQYLKDNNLQPKALLKDGAHLNEHGRWLMAELLKRFLVHLPDEPADDWRDTVKTYEVGKDLHWKGYRLTVEFEGNRVEALAGPGTGGKASVAIDGKKPSDLPECYSFTRPSGTPGVGWPAIKKITWQNPPVVEQWTALCSGFNDKHDDFTFTVTGSVTGADGAGRGSKKFVSKSGRIVIEPTDWVFAYDRAVSKKKAPDNWKVRWNVIPLFVDEYVPPKVADASREYATVLASDLSNAKHKLELVAVNGHKPAIRALRVYKPPLK